jgi:hypothetical protein
MMRYALGKRSYAAYSCFYVSIVSNSTSKPPLGTALQNKDCI